MTFLQKDIRDHLLGSSAIVDAFSDRFYPDYIPQNGSVPKSPSRLSYPCVVISDITSVPYMHLGGEVGNHQSTIQIDVWTDGTGGKPRANELSELIRNRLNGYKGIFGSGCFGYAEMSRHNPLASTPIDGSDTHRRRESMDFKITHTADVPTFS